MGSEILTSLDFEWSNRGWFANGLDFKWDLKFWKQPLEIRTNGRHFVKKHLKCGQKCPDFERSGFQMVGTITKGKACPFENRTIWNPFFKKGRFQMFPDFKWSDFRSHCAPHLNQKINFKMPTKTYLANTARIRNINNPAFRSWTSVWLTNCPLLKP